MAASGRHPIFSRVNERRDWVTPEAGVVSCQQHPFAPIASHAPVHSAAVAFEMMVMYLSARCSCRSKEFVCELQPRRERRPPMPASPDTSKLMGVAWATTFPGTSRMSDASVPFHVSPATGDSGGTFSEYVCATTGLTLTLHGNLRLQGC